MIIAEILRRAASCSVHTLLYLATVHSIPLLLQPISASATDGSFAPMSLYESDALKFNVKGNQLIPPFVSVAGLGETAALDIAEGRKGKDFISVEEFAMACPKVSKTHIEKLREAGAFGDMPDTSQITMF